MRRFFAGLVACTALGACAQTSSPEPREVTLAPQAQLAIDDTEPDVTRQVSAILGEIGQGKFSPDQLTENARAAMPAARMQALMAALRPCGAAPALELLRRTTKGEDRQYAYRAPCGGDPRLVEIDFNKGAKINRLSVRPEPR